MNKKNRPKRRYPKPDARFKNDGYPVFSFKFSDKNKYTLFDWPKEDLYQFIRFLNKVESRTWNMIQSTAGKSDKSGLAFTQLKKSQLPVLPANISEDVTIFELRINEKMRVFAFRTGDICNFVWFDRTHQVYR